MSETGGSPGQDHLTVVPESVRAVGNDVYELAENLRSALESAGLDVDSLLDDGWTGSSSAEFARGWTEVRDGGTTIIRSLIAMAEKLTAGADSYAEQDGTNASNLSNSSLDLP